MEEELGAAVMDAAQIAFAQSTHTLLETYVDERLAKPLVEASVTSAYLSDFLQLLETVRAESRDEAVYADTALLVKCFALTALATTDEAEHTLAVIDWVQSVDRVVGRWPREALDELLALENPAATPWFWPFVQDCVLSGRFDDAAQLVRKTPDSGLGEFQDLVWLLEAYPISSKYASFMQWRQNALALHTNLDTADQNLNQRLRPILPLVGALTGSVEAINAIAASWAQSVAALYLFNDPSAEMLSAHFAAATQKHPVTTQITWEEGCEALFQSRVVAALGSLRALDLTAALAVTEFCSEHGVLEKYASAGGKAGGGIRERLAIQYARACLAEPPLVDIGLELLANVATPLAKEAAEALLPQLVTHSYDSAPAAIVLAQQLGLQSLRQRLCHVAAEVAAADKRYASAVSYLYEASDFAEMRTISLTFFREMLVARKPVGDAETLELLREPSQISGLGLPSVLRDTLAPAAVLLQLLDALEAEDATAISENLAALLRFPAEKAEFCPLVVALAGDLNGAALTTETTVLLMQTLAEWSDAPASAKEKSYELIAEAMSQQEWQKVLHPGYRPSEVVWLLRRHLAKEIVL